MCEFMFLQKEILQKFLTLSNFQMCVLWKKCFLSMNFAFLQRQLWVGKTDLKCVSAFLNSNTSPHSGPIPFCSECKLFPWVFQAISFYRHLGAFYVSLLASWYCCMFPLHFMFFQEVITTAVWSVLRGFTKFLKHSEQSFAIIYFSEI